ncbi:PAS domain S-box protein [Lacrimispora sp.]|uniref:PAS domain S-box protein n=2 Tax=Lacrimispora TaxID=2719231 RepID=UPI0029E78C47|nr:diguanylate cyclase [Lacrimispora sp.]
MTNEPFDQAFLQLPLGYARYTIIVDDISNAKDYILAEANEAFLRYLNLKKEEALHKSIFLILQSASDQRAWYHLYKNPDLWTQEHNSILTSGNHSYKVTVSYPDSNTLVTIFDEVTTVMNEFHAVNEANEKLVRDIDIFFNSTQDGLFLVAYRNGEFRYIKNNAVHQHLTGITSPLLGKTPFELLGEKVGAALKEGYEKCILSGEAMIYEETVDFPEGTRDWLVRLTPVKENGTIDYIIGSRLDITELKRLKKEREQLLANFNSMFTEHSAIMLIIDAASGKILDANPQACSFYGYSKEEILQLSIDDINTISSSTVKQLRNQALNQEQQYFLFPHRLKSGEIKMVDVYSSPVTYGNDTRLYSIIFDVSDREQYRDDLFREKEMLSVTLNSIGDGVVTTDLEGKVTYLNHAAEEITGWRSEEASEKTFMEIFDLRNETTGKIVPNPISAVLETGMIVGLANHTVLLNKNGNLIPIADSAAPIRDENGHVYGVVMVFRDVSQDKRQQERILYLSYHDPLTQIFNRRYMEEEINRMDQTSQLPIAVIMGDVNGLKVINDVFGHRTGDLLLKEVAKTLQYALKNIGIAGRWGGDEFLILLPHTDHKKAQDIISRLEDAFRKSDRLPLEVSVALGFDVKEEMSHSLNQSLQKAEEKMYHKKLLEGKSYRNSIITTLLATLYEKSMETEEHAVRLETYCMAIADKLNLSAEDKNELSLLAILHDIGKVGVNIDTLNKPGPLNDEEWKEMMRHPEIGYRIAQNTPELSTVSEYILSHHERWDGSGYPRGLKGTDIPLLCRILAVADAYDAMTNNRSYRKAMDSKTAMSEIDRCSGTQFDPFIVHIFLNLNQVF